MNKASTQQRFLHTQTIEGQKVSNFSLETMIPPKPMNTTNATLMVVIQFVTVLLPSTPSSNNAVETALMINAIILIVPKGLINVTIHCVTPTSCWSHSAILSPHDYATPAPLTTYSSLKQDATTTAPNLTL
jgi:hypothetical protein